MKIRFLFPHLLSSDLLFFYIILSFTINSESTVWVPNPKTYLLQSAVERTDDVPLGNETDVISFGLLIWF